MASGLAALLDDVAALAKLAAASIDDVGAAAGRASVKAAGVVVDDTAVTPAYVRGLAAERELPIIKKIAIGSLRNKIVFILPAALILSVIAPVVVEIILMLGGTYLCFEGAEKIYHRFSHRSAHVEEVPAVMQGADVEAKTVSGAIRTDFILSAEIMVIALDEVAEEPLLSRALILVFVAFAITIGVYGVVGLIVKMDDIGLKLVESGKSESLGRGLVRAMPVILNVLAKVGIIAMLWVGGHILLVGLDELGVHFLYDFVHHLEEDVHEATGALGGVLGWLTNTIASAILGTIVGAIVVTVLHLRKGKKAH